MSCHQNIPNISHATDSSKEGDFGDKLVMSMAKDMPSYL